MVLDFWKFRSFDYTQKHKKIILRNVGKFTNAKKCDPKNSKCQQILEMLTTVKK